MRSIVPPAELAVGLPDSGCALIATRPFPSPHHTISDAGLIGGGSSPRSGEVSLAHHGVLFMLHVEVPAVRYRELTGERRLRA